MAFLLLLCFMCSAFIHFWHALQSESDSADALLNTPKHLFPLKACWERYWTTRHAEWHSRTCLCWWLLPSLVPSISAASQVDLLSPMCACSLLAVCLSFCSEFEVICASIYVVRSLRVLFLRFLSFLCLCLCIYMFQHVCSGVFPEEGVNQGPSPRPHDLTAIFVFVLVVVFV